MSAPALVGTRLGTSTYKGHTVANVITAIGTRADCTRDCPKCAAGHRRIWDVYPTGTVYDEPDYEALAERGLY